MQVEIIAFDPSGIMSVVHSIVASFNALLGQAAGW